MDLCLDDATLPLDTAEWVGVTGGTENYGWSIVYDSQSYTNVEKLKETFQVADVRFSRLYEQRYQISVVFVKFCFKNMKLRDASRNRD